MDRTAMPLELTVLMPCLNEAKTIRSCILAAQSYLEKSGVVGEVLVADNGSTDGSQSIALSLGARVIVANRRGYGAALIAGIAAAQGRFVVMGDSDESYDFSRLDAFIATLRSGAALTVGNRFKGGIAPDAMPPLHRYLGNPVLSFIGRLFFKSKLGDFHCGLRGFDREVISRLGLRCEGMEFASEMIVKASLNRLRTAEVPTTLSKDGRGRRPHLRTWRDGWRHLRFLLLFTPRWLFLYPGVILSLLGLFQLALALANPHGLGGWPVGIHTQLFAAVAMVIGYQTVIFSVGVLQVRDASALVASLARERLAVRCARGPLLPTFGAVLGLLGLLICANLTYRWGATGFGVLNPEAAMRELIPGVSLLLIGTQSLLASVFFAALRGAFEAAPAVDASHHMVRDFSELPRTDEIDGH